MGLRGGEGSPRARMVFRRYRVTRALLYFTRTICLRLNLVGNAGSRRHARRVFKLKPISTSAKPYAGDPGLPTLCQRRSSYIATKQHK